MKLRYLLSRTGGSLLRNKKKYLLFFIEIAIAGALSIVCVSFVTAGDREHKALENDPTTHTIGFHITYESAGPDEPRRKTPEFQMSDYQYIKQKYGDRLTAAFAQISVEAFTGGPNDLQGYRIIFATDEFFDIVYRAGAPDFSAGRTIYAPPDLISAFSRLSLAKSESGLTMRNFDGYDLRDISGISNGSDSICYFPDSRYENRQLSPLGHTLIAPLSMVEGNANFTAPSTLWISFPGQPDTATINDILQYFKTKYGDQYQYEFSSVLQSYETSMADTLDLVHILEAFAVICFTITAIGLFGLILLTVNRRRHDIATSMLLGAKRHQICLEFLLEIEAVVALGCLVGLGVGLLIGGILASRVTIFDFRIDAAFVGFLILFNVLGGAILSFAAINRILKIQPADAVRKDV